MSGSHHDEHSFAHPAPIKLLMTVFVALIVLTLLTVLTAGKVGQFGIFIALSIATVKAALVCLFFMHMWWDKSFNIIVFMTSFLFVSLFIGFTLMDTEHYQNTIDLYPRAPEQTTAVTAPK